MGIQRKQQASFWHSTLDTASEQNSNAHRMSNMNKGLSTTSLMGRSQLVQMPLCQQRMPLTPIPMFALFCHSTQTSTRQPPLEARTGTEATAPAPRAQWASPANPRKVGPRSEKRLTSIKGARCTCIRHLYTRITFKL